MNKKIVVLVVMLLSALSSMAQTNLIAGWHGGDVTTAPTDFGWASTYASRSWGALNGSGARLTDNYSGYTDEGGESYSYDSTDKGTRILWIRYNNTSETYTYTFKGLKAGHRYSFSGLVGWHNNSNAPTFTIKIGTADTDYASTSKSVATKQKLHGVGLTFEVPANETATDFQLKFTCNQAGDCMEALTALSIVEDNLIALWHGGDVATAPTNFGWASSYASRGWTGLNGSSGARVTDTYSGYTDENGNAYSYTSSDRGTRVLWIRYLQSDEKYTYTFSGLEKGRKYQFSGLVGWHNNSNAPTFTIKIGTADTDYASTSKYVPTMKKMYGVGLTFEVPEDETASDFQLKFTCNQTGDCMEALSALSIVEVSEAKTDTTKCLVFKLSDQSAPLYFRPSEHQSFSSQIDEYGNVCLGGNTFNLNSLEYIVMADTCTQRPLGDVNGDARYTILDLALATNLLIGAPIKSGLEPYADANGDGRITLADIQAISQRLLSADYLSAPCQTTTKPQTLWFRFADRSIQNYAIDLTQYDRLELNTNGISLFKSGQALADRTLTYSNFLNKGQFMCADPGRYITVPSTYSSNDYSNESSQWCLQRSAESEHFIIFWENGMTKTAAGNITYDGYTCNVNTLLSNAEKIWKCYVDELGFLVPGGSITDKVKIQMYIVKNGWNGSGDTWRADGSGVGGTVKVFTGETFQTISQNTGIFHCTTRASSSRGGHTAAHEIGHTFQYLVSADLGQNYGLNYGFGDNCSGGNEWWEDCANWQAYKVYPALQYGDGEYYEQYLAKHHLNIHHEDGRYANCFYQDWWCQLHGKNAVGRVWRETKKPEDPSQGYMRIFGRDINGYAKDMYDAYAHLASIDIDAVRSYGKDKIGNEPQRLKDPTEEVRNSYLDGDNQWWVVDSAYCPQNFGYNANPLKVPAAGTVVKAQFRGLVGAPGYRAVNTDKAGWRYGLVAYCSDGQRIYGDMQKDAEGVATLTVPANCENLWLVVMGAPTQYWRHAWDSDKTNDEQWPYAVKFTGTDPLGANHTYGEFPDDYARKDTTVVIKASLKAANDWSSVRVQLDMDAICQALGVSTAQLKAAVCGKQSTYPYVRIAGMNANGTTLTESKTISDTDVTFGHWFTSAGNVCSYGTSAYVYTKIYHNSYGCYVGQNSGKLKAGSTYIVREAVIYTDKSGKEYKAIMEIHLTAK